MPTLQKPHKAEDPSPTDDPFPRPESEVQTEMMKNIGLCHRSASSRRAQGSGRTYPPPTLCRSGPEALTNPTAGSAMAVEQGLELHMILIKGREAIHGSLSLTIIEQTDRHDHWISNHQTGGGMLVVP